MAKSGIEVGDFKREIGIPEQEQVALEKYAMNPRRYNNAIVERKDGLPESVLDLDEVSLRQMMNYIDRSICEYTGKSTYLDKVVSFINSGAYSSSYLNRVFGKRYVAKTRRVKKVKTEMGENNGTIWEEEKFEEPRYYIKSKNEYAKIEVDALQNWENKKLSIYFEEYLNFKHGKLTKEFVEQTILVGIKESESETLKLRWVKEATNVLGMNKGSNNLTQVNVYTDGGGKGLGEKISETSGNDNFNILGDD